jgi:hypothetical protein
MSDDKTKVGKPDRDRVNTSEPYELADWAKKWGVTPNEVQKAVAKVGPMAKDVQKALGK